MNLGPRALLLDAEAFSALAEGRRMMQVRGEFARRTDSVLYLSTVSLAEVTDGTAHDVRVRIAAKAVRQVDVSEAIGYTAVTVEQL